MMLWIAVLAITFVWWCMYSASEFGHIMVPINMVLGFIVGTQIGRMLSAL